MMLVEYENVMDEGDLSYQQAERTSDIQLPPVINIFLLTIWAVICLFGFAAIFWQRNILLGIYIIGIPSFLIMLIKPTFALCMLMVIQPTGAGIGIPGVFSLNRGVGIVVAVAFVLNLLVSVPRLRIGNKALWVITAYTVWVLLASLAAPHFALEIRTAFTMVQLLLLMFIVYWILETNSHKTFIWVLRSYVLGSLVTIAVAFKTCAAMRSMEVAHERYAATIGESIDANMVSVLIGLAFLTAVYLFARDKHILFRIMHLIAIVSLPVMMLKSGSRGGLFAFAVTLVSPLLFMKQVWRKRVLAVLMVVIIVLSLGVSAFFVKGGRLEETVYQRLTNVGQISTAFDVRLELVKKACRTPLRWPAGTSRYGWFERSGANLYPHSDFFYALGIYGIPGATLFASFVFMMMFTVKRMPLGLEKLYARAVLIFLLAAGLSLGQLGQKHLWVFFAIIMATERISRFSTTATEYVHDEEDEKTADINY